MKGLQLFLAPFAPDIAGAASILYGLHGMVVIVDAGGCAGNICGFDEPRWTTSKTKSAVFSAGLRDMDAIFGRDEHLIKKILAALESLKNDVKFIALLSTPVPAIIGTDYVALVRMIEKKTGLKTIAIETDGTKLCDDGEKRTWLALTGLAEKKISAPEKIGVLGLSPMHFSKNDVKKLTQKICEKENCGENNLALISWNENFDDVKNLASVKKIIAVSLPAVDAAKRLQEKFSVPYEIFRESLDEELLKNFSNEKKILLIAESLRAENFWQMRQKNCEVYSWFACDKSVTPHVKRLHEEEDFLQLTAQNKFDVIIADEELKRACENFSGEWIDLPHFAISGARESS